MEIKKAKQYILSDKKWREKSSFNMRYEDMIVSQEETVNKIASLLGIVNIDSQKIVQEIKNMSYESGEKRNDMYNTENLLHKNHITDGRHGSWHGHIPEDLVKQIEEEFKEWLKDNNYL